MRKLYFFGFESFKKRVSIFMSCSLISLLWLLSCAVTEENWAQFCLLLSVWVTWGKSCKCGNKKGLFLYLAVVTDPGNWAEVSANHILHVWKEMCRTEPEQRAHRPCWMAESTEIEGESWYCPHQCLSPFILFPKERPIWSWLSPKEFNFSPRRQTRESHF